MEAGVLRWIHSFSHPWLDALFVFSDRLANIPFCVGLVFLAMGWHLVRRERRAALLWLALGLLTLTAQAELKLLFARPRPELWPRLVSASGHSMPSGHALASAAFYPLLAAVAARLLKRRPAPLLALAGVSSAYVGLGRLYLGVHWPSDVLAGWLLGALFSLAAIVALRLWAAPERPL